MRADTQLPQLYAGGQGPYCGPQNIWAGAVRSKNKTQLVLRLDLIKGLTINL